MGVILTQYSLKTAYNQFGVSGEESVVIELNQLHCMENFFPVDPKETSYDKRVKAAVSLMFLKYNKNGKLKGRGGSNRSKQCSYIYKEDAMSPTAATESIFITETVYAHTRRNVAVFDILGVYLHTETDKDVIIVLEGVLTKLMVKVVPLLYRKYVTVNRNGKSLLYVKINKAITDS